MKNTLQKPLLLTLSWLFVVMGIIGAFLPVLPTTPFLILALVLFSKNSPRFHQMLLRNNWFGPTLKQWEATKSMSLKTKHQASVLIIIAFSISIAMLGHDVRIQLLMACMACVLLFCIWRIKESVS